MEPMASTPSLQTPNLRVEVLRASWDLVSRFKRTLNRGYKKITSISVASFYIIRITESHDPVSKV